MTKRAFTNRVFSIRAKNAIKFLLIVKLTALLLTVSFINVYASAYSQTVSFNGKNISLEAVFYEVEKQTGYFFLYPEEILRQSKPVTASVNQMPLLNFLDLIFSNQPLKYSVGSRTINVSIKPGVNQQQRKNFEMPVDLNSEPQILLPIRGIVRDDVGIPLSGATIRVKDSDIQAIADAQGYFTLDLKPGDILIISYVEHHSREIRITETDMKKNLLEVLLTKIVTKEEEISITTGIFQKADKSFTGSSTTVSAQQLQQFGNRNLIVSLKNIDPSFNILENNISGSDPNRIPDILIRGNSSLPNIDNLDELAGLNTPLVILDGFQSSIEKMLDININEVESVTILKDAAATAIYGSRASNGVIVINTKRPAPGKLRIHFRSDLNMESAYLKDYNLLNAGDKLDLEKRMGFYDRPSAMDDIRLKKYYNYILNDINQGVNTNWLELPLQTGIGQRQNISLSGGENAFRYNLSAQINNIRGVMKGSGRNTFNGTINLAYVYKNVRLRNQVMITEGKSFESSYGAFSDYAMMNPYWRVFDERGNPLKVLGDPGENIYVLRFQQLPVNPLYNATLNTFDKSDRSELVNNSSIELNFNNGLRARGQFGISKRSVQDDRYRPAEHTAFAHYGPQDIFRRGDYNFRTSRALDYEGSVNLQYSKEFNNKHTFFSGLDYNIRQAQISSLGFIAEGFSNARLDMMSMALQYAKDQKPTGSENFVRAMGITGNVNYIYNDLYFADFSVRMDGSSQFGKNNRLAPFWAAGIGWNLHKESFLENNKVINKLKLRSSAGVTGSQNFRAYQALSTYRYYPDDRYFSWNGAYLMGLGNEDLKWQQALQFNTGIDAEFFNGRVLFTGDYYNTHTKNLFSTIELPASNGFPGYVENIGSLSNEGFELKGTGILVKNSSKGLFWSLTAGIFRNTNKIIRTSKALQEAQKNRQLAETDNLSLLYLEGYSINTIWVVPSLGIDPSNGKEVYLDINDNPTYVWNGKDMRAMGNTDPRYMGNLSTLIRYNNFTFNVSFAYRVGGQQYNQTLISKVENANFSYNVDSRVYHDRWEKPGDKAAFKGLDVTARTYRSSRFVQDEYTLSCQNIFMEYLIKSDYLSKNLKINLLQVTAGMAEPFRFSSIQQERGTAYPFSKQISFSISATF